ncbi:hypothetical protein K3555_12260 [Leisingera sp. M527]|uniref:hypothetical protein n=1 Tax=Leisingera sp. M527 TaxID=2867014 RepID=UPI0021A761C3|nr:hypothetical protein [Leisingera sp. M527]UWQ31383.1 hypothetical protein K3555_12260 [Leisingera sp. M527]
MNSCFKTCAILAAVLAPLLPALPGAAQCPPEKRLGQADKAVFIGGTGFLARKARQSGAAGAAAYFFSGRRAKAVPESTDDKLARLFSGTNCAVSLNRRPGQAKAYVFTTPEDLGACLPRQFLLVAGLLPFEGETPSALNLNFN